VGKGKKGGKGRKGAKGSKEKGREGREKGRRRKGAGKGILAIPIIVCFRRRCQHYCITDLQGPYCRVHGQGYRSLVLFFITPGATNGPKEYECPLLLPSTVLLHRVAAPTCKQAKK